MATILQVKKRTEKGKKNSKKIRNSNLMPAIIYGEKKEPISITLNPIDFLKALNNSDHKKNEIFDLDVDGKKETVIIKEIVVNPLNNQFIHADFFRINDKNPIIVSIPIIIEGTSAGQRMGGVLVTPKSTIKISCLPNNIPVNISVNIAPLTIGDNIRAKELTLDETLTLISNPRDILVKVEATKISKTSDGEEGEGIAEGSEEAAAEETKENGSSE